MCPNSSSSTLRPKFVHGAFCREKKNNKHTYKANVKVLSYQLLEIFCKKFFPFVFLLGWLCAALCIPLIHHLDFSDFAVSYKKKKKSSLNLSMATLTESFSCLFFDKIHRISNSCPDYLGSSLF